MSDSTWRCWCTIVFALNLPCRSVCANWCQNLKMMPEFLRHPAFKTSRPGRHAMPVGTFVMPCHAGWHHRHQAACQKETEQLSSIADL
ncbi:hypothetical protein PVAP13_6NG115506 [Panicum virgatum]|uniref:Secreted protein n=1 Tax=Panicum virgatum TaxID=38727 RepID=A0A8T0R140_PANVG|nr:hypothetical protein PVAP13_6NG115506 [Panicum virgatum]